MSTLNTSVVKNASSSIDSITLETNGDIKLGGGTSVSYPGQNTWIEVGAGATGNAYAYLDFIGDTTYHDYGFRLLRDNAGADSASKIHHRGTGNLQLQALDANGQTVILKYAPQIPQAFVSFNGAATGTLHTSYNVSSVTDNGTGDYTVNFTTNIIKKDHTDQAMPAVIAQSHGPVNGAHCHPFPGNYQDGEVTIGLYNDGNSNLKADGNPVTVAVWG